MQEAIRTIISRIKRMAEKLPRVNIYFCKIHGLSSEKKK
jgi:hypothetical protein